MESSHSQSLSILRIKLMIKMQIQTILMSFLILVTNYLMFHSKMFNYKIKDHKKKLDLLKQIIILQ